MKKNILIIGIAAIIGLGLFSNVLKADNAKSKTEKKDGIKQEIRQIFSKEYSNEDFVNILAGIESDIKNNDAKAAQKKAEDISNYLDLSQSGNC